MSSLRWLRRFLRSAHQRRARPNPMRSVGPLLEPLEDRLVPSNKIWTGLNDGNWSNPANWIGGVPGAADIAVFDTAQGGTNAYAVIDPAFTGRVDGIDIEQYTGTVSDALVTLAVGASGYVQKGGGFQTNGNTLAVAGNWTVSGGRFAPGFGTVAFDAT